MKRSRLRRFNPERRARLRAEQFGPQSEACRRLPCAACNARAPSDPAHVRSRGAGGKDRANVIPLCRDCHRLQHAIGIRAFEERAGIDMQALADALALKLDADDA